MLACNVFTLQLKTASLWLFYFLFATMCDAK